MKKVLALVLAGVMAASMSVVAFAADPVLPFSIDEKVINADGDPAELKEPGDVVYYVIKANDGKDFIGAIKDVTSNYKLVTDNDSDKALDASAKLVAKKFGKEINKNKTTVAIEVSTVNKLERDPLSLDLTITLEGRKADVADIAVATLTKDLGFKEYDISGNTSVDKGWAVFDSDDEISLFFSDEEEAEFEVNVKNEKDLFLDYNNDEDETITDKFEDATLTFFNFNGNKDTFKKEGTLKLSADEDSFLYELVDGKLVAVKDAKYDSAEGVFTLKTKTLGNYIVSDTELVAAEGEEGEGSDAETNPDTGANDFVGLAVALAVVSVAGIAVAKRK